MTELAINATPEVLIVGGFLFGATAALIGEGVRHIYRAVSGQD